MSKTIRIAGVYNPIKPIRSVGQVGKKDKKIPLEQLSAKIFKKGNLDDFCMFLDCKTKFKKQYTVIYELQEVSFKQKPDYFDTVKRVAYARVIYKKFIHQCSECGEKMKFKGDDPETAKSRRMAIESPDHYDETLDPEDLDNIGVIVVPEGLIPFSEYLDSL